MNVDTAAAPATTPAPIETVTPIRPSEAIRLGCLTTAKTTGRLVRAGATCAVGAMLIGWYGPLSNDEAVARMSGDAFGQVEGRRERCPAPHPKGHPAAGACRREMSVNYVMQHLNDLAGYHEWSRERIADWLESLGL